MYGDARWHFMIVDMNGNNAIIEFLNGEPIIYKNSQISIKALCNFEYEKELNRLKDYAGFGGDKKINFNTDCADDPRFYGLHQCFKSKLISRLLNTHLIF